MTKMRMTGGYRPGQVVEVFLPFNDLTDGKFRPAVVLGPAQYDGEYYFCGITKHKPGDDWLIEISDDELTGKPMRVKSAVRMDLIGVRHISKFKDLKRQLKKQKLQSVIHSISQQLKKISGT